jgi:hypothetical protein
MLFACGDIPRLIILEQEKTVTEYNDTTFNSTGFITPVDNGFVIGDYMNKFIILVDRDVKNPDIIGRVGKGPDEYPVLPRSYIPVDHTIFMYDSKKTMYLYDLQTRQRTRLPLDTITGIIRDRYVFRKDDCFIFLTLPESPYNFVSCNITNGKISFFNTNKVLSELRKQNDLYMDLLENGIFAVVEYRDRTGKMYTFSVSDENICHEYRIPLNRALLDIFKIAPDIPAFDGICSWKNRILIAYNSTGLITTQIDALGKSNQWTFVDYPEDKTEDHVILGNFCATDRSLIFVNQGLIRFYRNPFQ